jgi:hypothetical protein
MRGGGTHHTSDVQKYIAIEYVTGWGPQECGCVTLYINSLLVI